MNLEERVKSKLKKVFQGQDLSSDKVELYTLKVYDSIVKLYEPQ